MSTTIRRLALGLVLALAGWVVLMALVMRVSDIAPAAIVPYASPGLMAALPSDAAILDLRGPVLTLANRPGLAADLYAAGAWLVLPAGLAGCIPLSAAQRASLKRRNAS